MTAPLRAGQFTVIVVADHSHEVRKFRVDRRRLHQAGWVGGALLALGAALGVHYASLLQARSGQRALAAENAQLRASLVGVQDRIARIAATLDRVERYDAKLRHAVTQLQDPDRGLAIGPVGKGEGEPDGEGPEPGATAPLPAPAGGAGAVALRGRLASLDAEAARQESSLRDLHQYFEEQRSLLASTPSVWPTRGWVTSDFGVRLDPYTAERMMHRGLDIATPPGQPVYAPSDATVVFAGTENGYGKVLVLDHGYGVKTRYGHLSSIEVRTGDRVRRGARMGAVGSTGRSTGPHLHYEVRVNGIAENPRKFILE